MTGAVCCVGSTIRPTCCMPSPLSGGPLGGGGLHLPGKAALELAKLAQILFVRMHHHVQFAEIGDLVKVKIGADDGVQVRVLLDDGAVKGRPYFDLGPFGLFFHVAPALMLVNALGLFLDGVDLLLGHVPGSQRQLDAANGVAIRGRHRPLRHHGDRRNAALLDQIFKLLQLRLVVPQSHQRIDQFAFLLAQILAQHHGQDLSSDHRIAIAEDRLIGMLAGKMSVNGAQGDDLAGEARLHATERIRIEGQRSTQLQRPRRHRRLDRLRKHAQSLDHFAR